ncbi:uncharacterized protein DFL_008704 [Arthrobotrys flagrans]|uniref:Ig-like domain-containing protein n=1 Tax=Arthrobotrys flagrans TaxID=97331 RepID=A0A436ZPQ3_ARTFL|nr:hypothetical protein DFL_008704 [Arthrobotrys flagrans]
MEPFNTMALFFLTLFLLPIGYSLPTPAPRVSSGVFTCQVRSSCESGLPPYRNAPRVASRVVGYYAPGTKLKLSCYAVTELGGCGDSKSYGTERVIAVWSPAGLRLCQLWFHGAKVTDFY